MGEATRSRAPVAEAEGWDRAVVVEARAARSIATGLSGVPAVETWSPEGTHGAGGAFYDPLFFTSESLARMTIRGGSKAPEVGPIFPFCIDLRDVPGYLTVEDDRMTRAVSVPKEAAKWVWESQPRLSTRECIVPGWRSTRTAFSYVELPMSSETRQSGRQALEELTQWLGLPHEALGALIGASRRSVYNWLRGRAMSSQFEARALRLRSVMRSLAERRAPGEIAAWLEAGSTPPAELLREQRWEDVRTLVEQELKPTILKSMPTESETGEPEAYSAETRSAVLAALRTRPPVEQPRRPDWRPREVTGTAALDDHEIE